jgi:hypothetical protein
MDFDAIFFATIGSGLAYILVRGMAEIKQVNDKKKQILCSNLEKLLEKEAERVGRFEPMQESKKYRDLNSALNILKKNPSYDQMLYVVEICQSYGVLK